MIHLIMSKCNGISCPSLEKLVNLLSLTTNLIMLILPSVNARWRRPKGRTTRLAPSTFYDSDPMLRSPLLSSKGKTPKRQAYTLMTILSKSYSHRTSINKNSESVSDLIDNFSTSHTPNPSRVVNCWLLMVISPLKIKANIPLSLAFRG